MVVLASRSLAAAEQSVPTTSTRTVFASVPGTTITVAGLPL
jgi:hypothetical protein